MKDKKTLITIIVLLVVTLPAAIYGTYSHITAKRIVVDDNPSKEYILNNKVYFYNGNVLAATYECLEECSVVTPIIDDKDNFTNYYALGKEQAPTRLNNSYALFKEGYYNVIYSVTLKNKVLEFDSVKTYNVKHSDPILIVKNNGKYSVISLESMSPILSGYDYIAIPNRVNDGVLDTSRFIAKQGSEWMVVEKNGASKHDPLREMIVDFNDKYIVTRGGGSYRIYDYEYHEELSGVYKKSAYCIGNYTLVIDSNNTLNLYNDLNSPVIKSINLPNYTTIDFELKGNKIDIYLDGNNAQSIVLT